MISSTSDFLSEVQRAETTALERYHDAPLQITAREELVFLGPPADETVVRAKPVRPVEFAAQAHRGRCGPLGGVSRKEQEVLAVAEAHETDRLTSSLHSGGDVFLVRDRGRGISRR